MVSIHDLVMDNRESQVTNPFTSDMDTNASAVSTPVSNKQKFMLFL